MTLKSFEKQFDKGILQRAKEHYDANAVIDLDEDGDGGWIGLMQDAKTCTVTKLQINASKTNGFYHKDTKNTIQKQTGIFGGVEQTIKLFNFQCQFACPLHIQHYDK